MAKHGNKVPLVAGILVLVIVGAYIASPDSFKNAFNVGGGVPVSPDRTDSIGTQDYEGLVTINVVHSDALDSAESRTEQTNLATTYYKLVNCVYKSIGAGSASGGTTVFIDAGMDRIFTAVAHVSGQAYYVAPMSTADPAFNKRFVAFDFFDISGDGTKEYVFTTDVTGLTIVGGQTTPTIDLYIDSYDYSAVTLTAPADQTGIATTAGTKIFVEWDGSHATTETANAQYEYEIQINSTNTAKWDRGQSKLILPNVGIVSFADLVESSDGTNTFYKYTLGFGLDTANYVTIPQNVQNKADYDLTLVANFGSAETYLVQWTIRSITDAQGTASVSDTISLAT